MKQLKTVIFPLFVATVWISASEFIRNEFLFKTYWTDHYQSLGLIFPSEPVNGAVWGLWSLLFAILIYLLSTRFSLTATTIISWIAGFVLMWVVTANLGALPFGLLLFAVPLSIFEAWLATWIIFRFGRKVE